MASKYGRQEYGLSLYSDGHEDVEGLLVLSIGFVVAVTEVHRLEGVTIDASPTIASGIFTRSQGVESLLSVGLTVQPGILLDINNLSSLLIVPVTLTGELFRSANRQFESILALSFPMSGLFGLEFHLESTIEVSVTIEGGDDVYIGPFWDPVEIDGMPWTQVA